MRCVKVKCSECDAQINVPDDVVSGEIVTCPDCGLNYEVVKNEDGVTFKPAESIGEDWGE